MERARSGEGHATARGRAAREVPGIVIAHAGWRTGERTAGVRAFVYGERQPSTPTLPFGRWKKAS